MMGEEGLELYVFNLLVTSTVTVQIEFMEVGCTYCHLVLYVMSRRVLFLGSAFDCVPFILCLFYDVISWHYHTLHEYTTRLKICPNYHKNVLFVVCEP